MRGVYQSCTPGVQLELVETSRAQIFVILVLEQFPLGHGGSVSGNPDFGGESEVVWDPGAGGPCRRLFTYPGSDCRAQVRVGLGLANQVGVGSGRQVIRGLVIVLTRANIGQAINSVYNYVPGYSDSSSSTWRARKIVSLFRCRSAREPADHCYAKRPRSSAPLHQLVRVREEMHRTRHEGSKTLCNTCNIAAVACLFVCNIHT